MSSKTENTLLLPGTEGWEVWLGARDQSFKRAVENGPLLASELEKLPKGKILMGFPVREALAVPFQVQTEDASMFEDLAAMHLEKMGIRPETDTGRLTDVFPAGQDDGTTTLLNVVLSAPEEEAMPLRAPSQFDLSPRFFLLHGSAVTLWRELGRWVFAVTSGEKLIYFQSISSSDLGSNAVRDIHLALSQLSLQGVNLAMNHAVVWTSGHSSDPDPSEIHHFGELLGAEILTEAKPPPILPATLSQLVPANVRNEQRVKAEQEKRNLILAVGILMYFGLIGFFAWDYLKLSKELKGQVKELKQVDLDHNGISLFNQDWTDLAPLVDERNWPLTALLRVTKTVPVTQKSKNLRFKVFEANSQRVYIEGEALDIKQASGFGEALKKTMPEYDWKAPVIGSDEKTNRWKFRFESILIEGETQS